MKDVSFAKSHRASGGALGDSTLIGDADEAAAARGDGEASSTALRRLAAQRGSNESWGGGEGILRASAQPGAQLGHLERVVDAELSESARRDTFLEEEAVDLLRSEEEHVPPASQS